MQLGYRSLKLREIPGLEVQMWAFSAYWQSQRSQLRQVVEGAGLFYVPAASDLQELVIARRRSEA